MAQTPLFDYTASTGDVLNVTVFGEQQFSGAFRVGPTGTIPMPVLGNIQVGGSTLAEISDAITEGLRRLIKRPMVTVALDELASERKVFVTGEVQQVGPMLLPYGATVADAVTSAGPTNIADLRYVRLTRIAEKPLTLDLGGLRTGTVTEAFIPLEYGDAIYVPRLEDRIAVLGAVNEPGESLMPVGREIRVLEAISAIGGGLTEGADLGSAMILRSGEPVMHVDLRGLLEEGDLTQNEVLLAGDVIVVREAGKISVLGEVNAPQSFQVTEPVSVVEALALAGSTTPDADLRRAQIITPNGSIPVDLDALIMRGEMDYNVEMQQGDVLLVPPAAPETVLVVGAVENRGIIDIREQEQRDLLRLLTVAGPTVMANLKSVQIFREGEVLTLDVEAMLDGDLSENIALAPDDIVFVPEVNTIYLVGAVTRQGALPLTEDLSLLDVISTYGNFEIGNLKQVTVMRTGESGEPEFFTRNMGQLNREVAPEDMPLQEGDVIFVPYRERHFDWEQVRSILWSAGSLWGLLEAF
jgi:protein involved in polysaccharide export with SLBB domain